MTAVLEEHRTKSPRRSAAAEWSGIAYPGPIRVAVDRPCMTTDRVCAAPERYIPSRAIPVPCTAVAATSTSTQNKSAVPTATKPPVVPMLLLVVCFQTFLSLTSRASEDNRCFAVFPTTAPCPTASPVIVILGRLNYLFCSNRVCKCRCVTVSNEVYRKVHFL